MGAPIIGRTACPECGFGNAHVKRSEKCDYRFCPECGAIYHAKTERQKADLATKTRPLGVGGPTPTQGAPAVASPAPTPTQAKAEAKPAKAPAPTPTPTPAPAHAPAVKRSGFFGLPLGD